MKIKFYSFCFNFNPISHVILILVLTQNEPTWRWHILCVWFSVNRRTFSANFVWPEKETPPIFSQFSQFFPIFPIFSQIQEKQCKSGLCYISRWTKTKIFGQNIAKIGLNFRDSTSSIYLQDFFAFNIELICISRVWTQQKVLLQYIYFNLKYIVIIYCNNIL